MGTSHPPRILIIDDETMLLALLDSYLSELDYAVDTASDVRIGLEKIQKHPYDLIVTDLIMPGGTGNDVLAYVRDKVKTSIPVIVMSGTPWHEKDPRFSAVFDKPFSLDAMLETIEQLVTDSQAGSGGRLI